MLSQLPPHNASPNSVAETKMAGLSPATPRDPLADTPSGTTKTAPSTNIVTIESLVGGVPTGCDGAKEGLEPQLGMLDEIRKMGDLDSDSDEDLPISPGRAGKSQNAGSRADMHDAGSESTQVTIDTLTSGELATGDEWVQCEAPNCGKWRLLPPHIRAADLPEVFQCSMNFWNRSEANCSAPEALQPDGDNGDADANLERAGLIADNEEDAADDKDCDSDFEEENVVTRKAKRGAKRSKDASVEKSRGSKKKLRRTSKPECTKKIANHHHVQKEQEKSEPWRLIGSWVAVDFSGEIDTDDEQESTDGDRWWDCLVVDYDEEHSQHLVRWTKTDKEEWIPLLQPSEIRPTSSDEASLIETKTKPVVFEAAFPSKPPTERPELQGQCYQVLKPVSITVSFTRGSEEVGRCAPKQLVKALKAVQLETGQLRVMTRDGWISTASKRGVKFLREQRRLYLDKHDKRAARKVERRAHEIEIALEKQKVARKLNAETNQRLWVAAVASAKRKLRAHLLQAGELAADARADVSLKRGLLHTDDRSVQHETAPQRLRVRKSRTIDDDDEGDQRDATALLQSVLLCAPARQELLTRRSAARSRNLLAAVVLAACVRQRQAIRRWSISACQAVVRGWLIRRRVRLAAEQRPLSSRCVISEKVADGDDGIDWGAVDFAAIDEVAKGASLTSENQTPQSQSAGGDAQDFDDAGIDWDAVDQAELAAMESQQQLLVPPPMNHPVFEMRRVN